MASPRRPPRNDGRDVAARPSADAMIPESAPFSRGAARLAQRLLRRPAVARRGRVQSRRASCRALPPTRWPEQRTTARRGTTRHADRRAHAAGRGQAAAAQAVRRHGAAGLRPVRLPVRDLFQGHRRGQGDQAQPVRPRRQGDEPHAQAAARGGSSAGRRHRQREVAPAPAAADRTRGAARAMPGGGDLPHGATLLNGKGSEKDTRHVVFDIAGSGLAYVPGDSFGLYPEERSGARRCGPLAALRVPHDFPVGGKPIRDALIEDYSLGVAPDMLFELMSLLVGGERRREGQGAGRGRGPRWRRGHARRAGGDARSSRRCIPIRKRSSSAWSRCSRGSTPSPPRRWPHRASCT